LGSGTGAAEVEGLAGAIPMGRLAFDGLGNVSFGVYLVADMAVAGGAASPLDADAEPDDEEEPEGAETWEGCTEAETTGAGAAVGC